MTTDLTNINFDLLKFQNLKCHNIPNSKMTYSKSKLEYKGEKLIINTPKTFSWGVSLNDRFNNNEYQLPLVFDMSDNYEFCNTFTGLIQYLKELVLENKDNFNLYDLEKDDLKKWDKFLFTSAKTPDKRTLYCKIKTKKIFKGVNQGDVTFLTKIYHGDEEVDMLDYCDKRIDCETALHIEGLYLGGGNISLQMKLVEIQVEEVKKSSGEMIDRLLSV